MDYLKQMAGILIGMLLLAIKLAPLRNGGAGKLGTIPQLRERAHSALRAYSSATHAEWPVLVGADVAILKQEENVAWTTGLWAAPRVADYSRTFFVRTPSNEYFMFLYRPNESPFVKHMEQRIARIKFGDQYIEPSPGDVRAERFS